MLRKSFLNILNKRGNNADVKTYGQEELLIDEIMKKPNGTLTINHPIIVALLTFFVDSAMTIIRTIEEMRALIIRILIIDKSMSFSLTKYPKTL
jgi:hypothetical protein